MDYIIDCGGDKYVYDPKTNVISGRDYSADSGESLLCAANDGVKIYVELTRQCNLKCKYCYLSLDQRPQNPDISTEEKYENFVSSLNSIISKRKSAIIVFYGGEPLIEWELLCRLVEYYDFKVVDEGWNVAYTVLTNGVSLNEERVAWLSERGIKATISLDGKAPTMRITRAIENTEHFDKMLALFSELNNHASVTATLDPDTIRHISDDLEYLFNLPVKAVSFLSCDSARSGTYLSVDQANTFCDEFDAFISECLHDERYDLIRRSIDLMYIMRRIDEGKPPSGACGYGCSTMAINQEGEVFPCACFLNYKEYVMTNGKIKYPPRPEKMSCSDCIAYSTCHGNCMYSGFIATQAPDDFMNAKCIIKRRLTKLALEVYVKLY